MKQNLINKLFSGKTESLEELVTIFQKKIETSSIQEKSFVIFNGKFSPKNSQEERSLEVKISFIRQQSKPYIILILRDTTQRDQVLTLEGNIKYKDHLLASVSHELRTPLNGNINLVEAAINNDSVPENIKEKLLVPALKSSKFLLHLINDILDMSQIKAKKLRLAFQQGNLKETLLNTIHLVELHAQKKGIHLEVSLNPSLPENFCTDHIRLSQIVLNLLNNSIKFTQKGSVKLTAKPLKCSNCIKISVKDTGIGMGKEDINKLFQDFTHIESSTKTNLNPTGVGLGLSIAFNLAKLLGPKDNQSIKVTSTLNIGSKFCFVIEDKQAGFRPFELKDESNQATDILETESVPIISPKVMSRFSTKPLKKPFVAGKQASSMNICECPKVLAVDDDPFNILAYESVLSSLSVKCDAVYNGKSAVEKLISRFQYPCGRECQPYWMVLMDQEMPVMNGIETVKEIRNLQKLGLLPRFRIIGCTAHKDKDEIDRFINSGIDDCIQKPISASVMKKILGSDFT